MKTAQVVARGTGVAVLLTCTLACKQPQRRADETAAFRPTKDGFQRAVICEPAKGTRRGGTSVVLNLVPFEPTMSSSCAPLKPLAADSIQLVRFGRYTPPASGVGEVEGGAMATDVRASGRFSVTLKAPPWPKRESVAIELILRQPSTNGLTRVSTVFGTDLTTIVHQERDSQGPAWYENVYVFPDGFEYGDPAPTIERVTPSSASVGTPALVTIRGTGFVRIDDRLPEVTIGGLRAISVRVESPTELTCMFPDDAPGKKDLTITNPDDQPVTLVGAFERTAGAAPATAEPSRSPASGEKFCMKCGTKLPEEAVFCVKCGKKQ